MALAGVAALPVRPATPSPISRVRRGQPDWPGDADWDGLRRAVSGRLSPVALPDLADPEIRKQLSDPFYIGGQPGLTQSSGWFNAWRSVPSAYVVAAESAADVAAAVRFANAHNLRVVVRGGGHSYLGTSTAPDSLMIWTRPMNAITVHDDFVPQGSRVVPVPAVSAGAGCIWLHLYQAVTGGAGRYVQGGGCTTVGVAGLVQGGGFGSFSKSFGTVAASLLEAEIVTADGETRIVNLVREPDLFWALKGGGGGTFGVVTRVTLATHDLPQTFGALHLDLRARSDQAYHSLLGRFLDLYATSLFNSQWGEQAIARPDNRLQIRMVFEGLTEDAARAIWRPLTDFASSTGYDGHESLFCRTFPANKFWDAEFLRAHAPGAVVLDSRPGAAPTDFWWGGDAGQVGAFWYSYTSAWLPASLLEPENRGRLVDAWFAGSRHWGILLALNKGLAGAPDAAIDAARNTAMHPDAVDAFALAITADCGPPAFAGMTEPDNTAAEARRGRVQEAMAGLRAAAPDSGAYVNECDYFQPDWQKAFWGSNYSRLLRIKQRYDPNGLFTVHHGVGSEAWSADGFTQAP